MSDFFQKLMIDKYRFCARRRDSIRGESLSLYKKSFIKKLNLIDLA